MDAKMIGVAAALGSAAAWAGGSILFKKLGESLSSMAMTLVKGALSVALLGLALVFTGFSTMAWHPFWLLALSGLLGIAVGDTCFFEALQDLGPVALVVLFMLGQVLTVILAVVFLHESPTTAAWIGIALVLIGILVVLHASLGGERKASRARGLAFGLASIACMSVSMVIAKAALESVSAIQATFIRMLAGTLGMLALGVATRRLTSWVTPFNNRRLLGLFFVSVCVVTFGGFWLSLVAVKHMDLAVANTLNSTEPLFILPLAAIFLKEKITWRAVLGTVTAVIGIVLICLEQRV